MASNLVWPESRVPKEVRGGGGGNLGGMEQKSKQSSDMKRSLCQELRFSPYSQRGVF